MSDELEKQLRELVEHFRLAHDVTASEKAEGRFLMLARNAARIGAELEREACAIEAELYDGPFAAWSCDKIADAIRARGGK